MPRKRVLPMTGAEMLALVHREPGVTTRALAARWHCHANQVSSALHYIASRGYLVKRLQRRIGGKRGAQRDACWYPSEKDPSTYVVLPYDTMDLILDALREHGPLTRKQLTEIIGRKEATIESATKGMMKRGQVGWIYGKRGTLTFFLLGSIVPPQSTDDEDDDWQPPTTYMSASRMYALGLK